MHTGKGLGLFSGYGSQMPQIALVSDKHDDDVGIRMVAQLLEPSSYVLVRLMLADVVDEKGADSAAVVGGRDGAVAFLAGRVPDLQLDAFSVEFNGSDLEVDADGSDEGRSEGVFAEAQQAARFANA